MGSRLTKYSAQDVSDVLAKPWWTLRDVAVYLNRTYGSARNWSSKVGLRKCPNDRRLTNKCWVDSALMKKN